LLEGIAFPVLDALIATIQNELATKIFGWLDTFGKHRMNELSGLRVLEGELTAVGEIPTDSADKRVLSVRGSCVNRNKIAQSY